MGITTICLVRHGETDWNACGRLQGKTDIPLNDKGRTQANQCGMYLAKSDWDVIISSPLKRAVETAEIISSYIVQPTILTMVEFIERDYGDAEGMTFTEKGWLIRINDIRIKKNGSFLITELWMDYVRFKKLTRINELF